MTFNFQIYANNPVLPTGQRQEWDNGTIYGPYVVEHRGTYFLFYSGAPSSTSASGLAIGYATSADGYQWTKFPRNPVLRLPDLHAAICAVLVDENTWVMYVSVVPTTLPGNVIYRVTAPSPDGPWTLDPADPVIVREGQVWDNKLIPQGIVKDGDEFRLYYIGMDRRYRNPQYGMATSTDGIHWTLYDDPVTTDEAHTDSDPILTAGAESDWDFMGITASNVLQAEDGWELFYVGYDRNRLTSPSPALTTLRLGYATSADGIHWTKYLANPVIDTGQTGWPLINVMVISDTYFIYQDNEFGAEGIALITGKITRG